MDSKISQREQWTSKLGFILAAAGSAVGLGNLWGFAYRASQGGGAAFVLLYILIVLIVCLPVFVAEMALGRNAMASTLLAPVKLAGKNWYPLGILFFIAPLGIASYYSVIMGWTADTLFHSLFFGLPKNLTEAETFFGSISSGSSVLLGHLLSLVLTAIIVSSGIKKGIEKVTRYFMPILFIIIVILAIWATSLSGAWEGYKTFLLKFDFNELRNPQTIRNAFTQAFFSLSLGIGIMVTYASYLNKKSNLPKLSVGVASLDTLVGLMAGFITFPIVLTFGLSDAETFFGSISSGSSVLLGHLLSLVLTAIIVSSGIKKGIEKVTRFFMPILFIILLSLAIWATSLSGAWEGYKTFLFKFDFDELRNPQTIRNAFTQAFFSLSLGIGVMVTYASYLNKKSNLPKLSVGVASLDTLVGLMAGLITFPIVLTLSLIHI